VLKRQIRYQDGNLGAVSSVQSVNVLHMFIYPACIIHSLIHIANKYVNTFGVLVCVFFYVFIFALRMHIGKYQSKRILITERV